MKILKAFAAAVSAAVLLTGCSFGSDIDGLMAPPKLSVEQEQIYKALTDATGTSISLKYPTSGKYLSAFIVEDIDGDGGNEAVVFYEKTGLTVEENILRINILDRTNGKWRSVCDTPAEGANIEKIIISRLGTNDKINLIIGTTLINRSEKNAAIYNYSSDGSIVKTFSKSCSFIDVTDLDGDKENEFLMLTGSSGDSPAAAEAYKLDTQGTYHQYSVSLSGSFTEFDKTKYGNFGSDGKALYIDAVSGTGYIQTDVIYMDGKGLHKVFETPEESLSTVRPSGCSCADIDGDGTIEIPVQELSPGYEDVSVSEQMNITEWMYIDGENTLKKKYSSYYSIADGYIFLFPEKWRDRITVKRDAVNDEIVFCSYTNGQVGRELMRLYCATDSPSEEDRLANGYSLLRTKGETVFLACIPEYEEPYDDNLALTSAELTLGFRMSE